LRLWGTRYGNYGYAVYGETEHQSARAECELGDVRPHMAVRRSCLLARSCRVCMSPEPVTRRWVRGASAPRVAVVYNYAQSGVVEGVRECDRCVEPRLGSIRPFAFASQTSTLEYCAAPRDWTCDFASRWYEYAIDHPACTRPPIKEHLHHSITPSLQIRSHRTTLCPKNSLRTNFASPISPAKTLPGATHKKRIPSLVATSRLFLPFPQPP
jgi:hypothetical protein